MSNDKDAAAAAAAEADAVAKAADAKKRKEDEEAAKAERQRLAEEDKTLIAMVKDGATTKVHPSCVTDHQRAGWKVKQ